MIYIPSKNADDGIRYLSDLRRYKPFQYGGKFFCLHHDGHFYCYRSKKSLTTKAGKLGLSSFQMTIIGKEKP